MLLGMYKTSYYFDGIEGNVTTTTVKENLGLINLFGMVAPLASVVLLLSPYHHIQHIGYYFHWEGKR